jgi:2-aminoethylphosphonate-pyruvate transaminase
MLRDLGSRDTAFIAAVRDVRARLVAMAGDPTGAFAAIPMQGSGTFSIEAVLASAFPPEGRLLVLVNGAYGRRIATIARRLRIDVDVLEASEDALPDVAAAERKLASDARFRMLALVHCETTSGIVTPLEPFGALARRHGCTFFVDAMSSFGAIPVDMAASGIDFLVSSANKCIEGVPGFAFVLARRAALEATEGWARSVSLDLLEQLRGFERDGQFRFTPPTHALLAFRQALVELESEGGVAGRNARYTANHRALLQGTRALGLREYVPPELQGPVITSFRFPVDPRFRFEELYRRLSDAGYVIYPGKVSQADCFRIGTIGRLFEADVRALVRALADTLREMGLALPLEGEGRDA